MDERKPLSAAQLDASRPAEQEAVRTTIVGGRPPGSGQPLGDVCRGIEVLVKKASVDPAFKELFLAKRSAAADEIDLKLDPAEAAMLNLAPPEQLEAVIASVTVPEEHRRAFLGKATVAMLAALGLTAPGCAPREMPTKGVRPDRPPDKPEPRPYPAPGGARPDIEPSKGIRPDQPPYPAPGGVRPDRPMISTYGIQPDRPSAPAKGPPDRPSTPPPPASGEPY
jgi:hypothetical protein